MAIRSNRQFLGFKTFMQTIVLLGLVFSVSLAEVRASDGLPDLSDYQKDLLAMQALPGCFLVAKRAVDTFRLQKEYKASLPYNENYHVFIVAEAIGAGKKGTRFQFIEQREAEVRKGQTLEWRWQEIEMILFRKPFFWQKVSLNEGITRNTWMLRKYFASGDPNYQCIASWHHSFNHHSWECFTWSPLPERERSQRSQYNVLARGAVYRATHLGWRHEQNNEKVLLEAGRADWLAQERVEIDYRKVHPKECRKASTYWRNNKNIWHDVQEQWARIFAERGSVQFNSEQARDALQVAIAEAVRIEASKGSERSSEAFRQKVYGLILASLR